MFKQFKTISKQKRYFSNSINPKLPDNNDLFMSFLAGSIGSMWTFPNCPSNTEKEKTLSMFSKSIGCASFGISVHYLLRYLKKF